MPVLPPSGVAPLDTVTNILNAARVKLAQRNLGTLDATSGRLLDWTQPASQQIANNAWRKLQQTLANVGHTQLKQEIVILNVPAVTSLDPASEQYLTWTGFFDGTNLLDSPYLPFDLIIPTKIWERASGQNQQWPKDPMELFFDGLPGFAKQLWNRAWEWRAGALHIPGATQALDFRLLYVRNLGDFVDDDVTPWFEAIVPLNDCMEAFACFICAEIKGTPDNPNAGGWLQAAENAARLMTNREAAMKQRGNIRRQSRSGRLEAGQGYGW